MAEDFKPLLASLRSVFQDVALVPLSEEALAAIRASHPGVPEHYLEFLRHVGWGSLGGSFMLYSGLCDANEIFDAETAADLKGVVFFGDNFSGDMIGFDTGNGWRLVSVGGVYLRPEVEEAKTVGEFIAQRIAEWQAP